jgi:hypothetical protein
MRSWDRAGAVLGVPQNRLLLLLAVLSMLVLAVGVYFG